MKEYVRVTDILGMLQDFSGIDRAVLEAKAKLGTNVHEEIAEYVSGGFPVLYTAEQNEWEQSVKAVGYFRSYEKWHSVYKPTYHRMEQRLFCDKLMITGQMDAVVTVGDDQFMLIDFKTSYKPNQEVWNLQAHFYYYLCKVNSIETSTKMQWINLQKGGGHPKVFTFEYNEFTMQRCIDMANKFWEDYSNAKDTE